MLALVTLVALVACAPVPKPAATTPAPAAAPKSDSAPTEDAPAAFASVEDYRHRTSEVAERLGRMGFAVDTRALDVIVAKDDVARAHLLRQMDVTTSEARLEGMATVRRLFGFRLGNDGRQLRELAALGMLSGAHAYYDFLEKNLIFRDQALTKLIDLDFTVGHELVHAYQDQLGRGLRAFFEKHAATQDESQAARGTIEGQAVLVSTAMMMHEQGNDIAEVDPDFRDDAQGRLLSGEGLNALYSAGYRFMLTRYKQGGFEEVKRLLDQPPTSTEQVLHPEKFPKDVPQKVTLPEWPPEAGPAERVHSDTLGEMLVYLLLVEAEVPFASASLLATGWDGDRYTAYRLSDGQRALLWRTVWDREEDAKSFEKAMRVLVSERAEHTFVGRSGAVVDLAFTETPALLPHLSNVMKRHGFRAQADPFDARTTAAAEARVVKKAELEPRLEGGYWIYPEYSVKIPVLDGWRLVNIRGAQALAGQIYKGLADNITVVVDQDLVGGNLEKYLEQNQKLMARTPTQTVLHSEVRTISGKKTGILDVHITTGQIRLKARAFIIPRPGRFVVVQAGFHEERWDQVQPVLEAIEKQLVIEN